ncbi:MAG: SIMPL domain-containing protein [Candidatus Dormibacteria bacterium]
MEDAQSFREGPDTITMSGVGTTSVPPDRVEIWLQVVGEDRDKGRAYEKAARHSKRLVELLDDLEIPERRRITTGVQVDRRYDERGQPDGYRAQATVQIRLDADGPLSSLISRAVDEAEANVGGPYWSVSGGNPQNLEVVRRAATDARQRAEVCADSLGLALGRPIRIQEEGGIRPRHQVKMAMMGALQPARAAAGPSQVEVESGSVLLEARLIVTFALAPGPRAKPD